MTPGRAAHLTHSTERAMRLVELVAAREKPQTWQRTVRRQRPPYAITVPYRPVTSHSFEALAASANWRHNPRSGRIARQCVVAYSTVRHRRGRMAPTRAVRYSVGPNVLAYGRSGFTLDRASAWPG